MNSGGFANRKGIRVMGAEYQTQLVKVTGNKNQQVQWSFPVALMLLKQEPEHPDKIHRVEFPRAFQQGHFCLRVT